MQNHSRTLTLCEGAVSIAASLALSYLKIPIGLVFGGFGGSVDLVMLPLIVFAARRGGVWGVTAGFLFGTLKFYLAGGVAVNWQSMLLDYSLAYAAVGIGGFLSGTKRPLLSGAALGSLCRFGIHYLSGVTIYAQYMPDMFMERTMTSPSVYSLLYNGSYMLPNAILALVLCAFLEKPLSKWTREQA